MGASRCTEDAAVPCSDPGGGGGGGEGLQAILGDLEDEEEEEQFLPVVTETEDEKVLGF